MCDKLNVSLFVAEAVTESPDALLDVIGEEVVGNKSCMRGLARVGDAARWSRVPTVAYKSDQALKEAVT